MCCVFTVCWFFIYVFVRLNLRVTLPPGSIVLPDFFSSFPLLSKPFVSVRCFLLWHISLHLNFHSAQSDWCFKTETDWCQSSDWSIHSASINSQMIKLARCSFSVSHWMDSRALPVLHFPSFSSISSYLLLWFCFKLPFFAPFLTPMPLLFFFVCSKRERMRKQQPADSAALLMSGLWRHRVWAWAWQVREVGSPHNPHHPPPPSPAA